MDSRPNGGQCSDYPLTRFNGQVLLFLSNFRMVPRAQLYFRVLEQSGGRLTPSGVLGITRRIKRHPAMCHGYFTPLPPPWRGYCQVEAFRTDPTPRCWQRRALKPVVSKNTNELKTGAPGPFRSSSTRGEPQVWGSEAMSAIRVPRTRRENTVQQRDATLPDRDLDPGSGRTWTRTC